MDEETANRRSSLAVAGVASLCCIGPGTAAMVGGAGGATTGTLGGGLVEMSATALALALAAVVIGRRRDCESCD